MNKIFRWIYLFFHSIFIRISIALFNTEMEILKADPNINDEKNKITQRKRHRNELLEKFYAGQRDEKYTKDYYEILKKSDEFLKKSTPFKMAVAADKYAKSYAIKDKSGRTFEHFGFFDDKHKYSGKTLDEVIDIQYSERRTTDDDYELLYIFNNKPIEIGIFDSFKIKKQEKTYTKNAVIDNQIKILEGENEYVAELSPQKRYKFPITIHRHEEVLNKIEELTEFLHIKKTAFDNRILEFFIPIKYKTTNISENDSIFKELININELYFNDEYGNLVGYKIHNYRKRILHNEIYDVIKFDALEMKTYSQKIN